MFKDKIGLLNSLNYLFWLKFEQNFRKFGIFSSFFRKMAPNLLFDQFVPYNGQRRHKTADIFLVFKFLRPFANLNRYSSKFSF